MSFQEKRTIVSLLTEAVILAAYCIYAFNQYASGAVTPDDLEFWAATMLIFIGIGIVAAIVIQIVFHILTSIFIAVREKVQDRESNDADIDKAINAEMVEDEMDKLIELKSMRFGFVLCGIGFVAGLISLVLQFPPALMLNILFISFSIGALLEGAAQLFYYRRGIRNG
jgi:hypothetical protein